MVKKDMILPKPTIVIFDMDGTTVRHLNPKWLGAMEWVDDTVYKITRVWAWLFDRGGKGAIFNPEDLTDPEREVRRAKSLIVHETIHKLRNKPVELLVEPCPGVYSVLSLLKKNNVPMALVSNGLGKGYGQDVVEKFGLAEYFPVTIFREDIHKSKPHPESLLLALGRLSTERGFELSAQDVVWFIGDRHKDVKAAMAAQAHLPCKIFPVAYGLNAAVAAIEMGYGPDHILMSYRDIGTLLKKLLGDKGSDLAPAKDDQSVMRSGS